jgi:hypothetical protein
LIAAIVTGAVSVDEKLMVTTAVPELPTVSAPALVTGVDGIASGGFTTLTVTDAVLVR